MTKLIMKPESSDHHMGCFGDFAIEDAICRKFCALRLRCAVEREQNSRMEMLEELLSSEGVPDRVQ